MVITKEQYLATYRGIGGGGEDRSKEIKHDRISYYSKISNNIYYYLYFSHEMIKSYQLQMERIRNTV